MIKEQKEGADSVKPPFIKNIDYAKNEPWRTDAIFGSVGQNIHGHLAVSGAKIFYLRDGDGTELIVNGVVKNISQ